MKFIFSAAILITFVFSTEIRAQTICFCLENPNTKKIARYGCESRVIESRGIERVNCQTPDFTTTEPVTDFADYTRIPDGDGLCVPCYASPDQGTGDIVRGDDSQSVSSDEIEASEEKTQ